MQNSILLPPQTMWRKSLEARVLVHLPIEALHWLDYLRSKLKDVRFCNVLYALGSGGGRGIYQIVERFILGSMNVSVGAAPEVTVSSCHYTVTILSSNGISLYKVHMLSWYFRQSRFQQILLSPVQTSFNGKLRLTGTEQIW